MAHIHNALHRATALQAAYQVALGELNAEFPGIERAGETITPIIDLWSLPEWALLRDETLCAGQLTQAAVALEFAFVGVANPADSRMLLVVERIRAYPAAATDSVTLRRTTEAVLAADELASQQLISRDQRAVLFRARSLIKRGTLAAVDGDALELLLYPAATTDVPFLSPPIVLPPGQAIAVENEVVNSGIRATFVCRERRALPGELE